MLEKRVLGLVKTIDRLSPPLFMLFLGILAQIRGWTYLRIEYPGPDGELQTATITPQGDKMTYNLGSDTVRLGLPPELPHNLTTQNPLSQAVEL